eukprot:723698-Amphidinium_carterae.1
MDEYVRQSLGCRPSVHNDGTSQRQLWLVRIVVTCGLVLLFRGMYFVIVCYLLSMSLKLGVVQMQSLRDDQTTVEADMSRHLSIQRSKLYPLTASS